MSEHDVTVDPGRIQAEFLRYGEPGPGDYRGRGEYDQPQAPPRPWKEVAQGAAWAFKRACTNWEISDQERDELAAAIESVLDKHFPGGMSMADSWGPWSKLFFVLASIALAHGLKIDWQTFEVEFVPPVVFSSPEDEPEPAPAEPTGEGADQGPQRPPPRKKAAKKRASRKRTGRKKAAAKKKAAAASEPKRATIG